MGKAGGKSYPPECGVSRPDDCCLASVLLHREIGLLFLSPFFSFTVLPQLKTLPRFRGGSFYDQRCGLLFANSSFRNNSNNLSHRNSSLQPTKLFHICYGVCFFNVLRATPARKQGVCYDHSLSMGESTAQLRRFSGCAQSWGLVTEDLDLSLVLVASLRCCLHCCMYVLVEKRLLRALGHPQE